MRGLTRAALVLVSSLSWSGAALAQSWDDYQLGEFYPIEEVTEPVIQAASDAVVYFRGATGFLVSPEGHVLTNYHVYDSFGDSGTIRLQYREGGAKKTYKVKLVVAEEGLDMALYQIEGASGLPYLPLRSAPVSVGEEVFIVGHPDSKPQRASFGKILARNLTISGRPSVEYSAQTWWGSSGSPVCDREGRVVALHWGWDAEGLSNGRLTGVPASKLLREVPALAEAVRKITPSSTPSTTAPATTAPAGPEGCDDAARYSLHTTLRKAGTATTRAGYRLDEVSLRLDAQDPRCLGTVSRVSYQLHETFSPSRREGDATQDGFPLVLRAWGYFAVRATVTLADGTQLSLPGEVRW